MFNVRKIPFHWLHNFSYVKPLGVGVKMMRYTTDLSEAETLVKEHFIKLAVLGRLMLVFVAIPSALNYFYHASGHHFLSEFFLDEILKKDFTIYVQEAMKYPSLEYLRYQFTEFVYLVHLQAISALILNLLSFVAILLIFFVTLLRALLRLNNNKIRETKIISLTFMLFSILHGLSYAAFFVVHNSKHAMRPYFDGFGFTNFASAVACGGLLCMSLILFNVALGILVNLFRTKG